MKLRVSQVGGTLKVNKERNLSRCGLLARIRQSTNTFTLSFFVPVFILLNNHSLVLIYICNILLVFYADRDSDRHCKVLSNDTNNKKRIRG